MRLWSRGLTVTFGLAFLLLLTPLRAVGDDAAPPLTITIPRVQRPLTLEELLDGGPRKRAAVVTDFVQRDPREGEPPSEATTAYLAYDKRNLYVGVVCRDRNPDHVRARVTRRDAIWGDDTVEVLIDTYYDHRRSYVFAVNPLGIQADYAYTDLHGDDFTFDTLWSSEGQLTANGYVVLFTIPFKSLRFSPERQQTWGIILTRYIPHLTESITWPLVSRKFSGWLSQEAEARGLENISPGKNAQIIPYGYFSSRRLLDKETSGFRRERLDSRLGIDAKWVVASNLTLDATVNPDFSHVESDEPQITANRRFEVFFPEKRPFFLENSNYFETPTPVLFTRRIADPQFGIRLTGKVGPYTLAAFAADDRAPGETVAPDDPSFGHRALFNVVRLSRDIHKESSVGMIWSDREFREAFNRVFGVDGRWKFSRTTGVSFQFLKSLSQDLNHNRKEGSSAKVGFDHYTRHWNSYFGYNERSPGFEIASGFTPRVDFRSVGGRVGYVFRPEGKWVVTWHPYLNSNLLLDYRNQRQDYSLRPGVVIRLGNGTHAFGHYGYKRELYQGIDFLERRGEFGVSTHYSRWFSTGLYYEWGQQINYFPVEGRKPFLGEANEISFGLTLRPTARLAVENTVLENRLLTINEAQNIFNNSIFRSKWSYQFSPRLSLRVIGRYSNVLPSASASSLAYSKNLFGDMLLTYLVHPGTALYVGYSNMLENYDRLALNQAGVLARSRADLLSTGAGLFVKFSYLYQF